MTLIETEYLLRKYDLVAQKSLATLPVVITTNEGTKQSVFVDGCVIVSLYNALILRDNKTEFSQFVSGLSKHGCLEKQGINWRAFNEVQCGLQFTWMQDNEIPGCEKVDTNQLNNWVTLGNPALVKVESPLIKSRRHFMLAMHADDQVITCLESGRILGGVEIKNLDKEKILGVRYLITDSKVPNAEE
jgi:hypothetical protein